jgi:hypothetical protein
LTSDSSHLLEKFLFKPLLFLISGFRSNSKFLLQTMGSIEIINNQRNGGRGREFFPAEKTSEGKTKNPDKIRRTILSG